VGDLSRDVERVPRRAAALGVPFIDSAALPPIEAVDTVPPGDLAAFIAHAAALQARAAMRLGAEGCGRPAASATAATGSADTRLLTAEDVAALLNAKRAWVYRHQRQLGGEKLDGLLRFSARRVHSYVERQRKAAA
jgi:hypothetical protein